MEYTWKKSELNKKLLLAKLSKDTKSIELYTLLLNILNDKETTEELNIRTNNQTNINLQYAKKYFATGLEHINEDLYSIAIDLYRIINNSMYLNQKFKYKRYPISNDELINVVRNIIRFFNNPEMLDYFDYLIHHNYLNIKEDANKVINDTQKTGGLTFYDYQAKKTYINTFRYYTIEDVEILLHEFFHAFFFNKNKLNEPSFHKLPELEGMIGSFLAYQYLEECDNPDALTLRKEMFSSIITESFLSMMNHILILNDYDPKETNKILKSLDLSDKISIDSSDIPSFLNIQGFNTITNIIAYLITLDIFSEIKDPHEIINILTLLKMNDTSDILENINDFNIITFHKDGLKNLQKERILIHK